MSSVLDPRWPIARALHSSDCDCGGCGEQDERDALRILNALHEAGFDVAVHADQDPAVLVIAEAFRKVWCDPAEGVDRFPSSVELGETVLHALADHGYAVVFQGEPLP